MATAQFVANGQSGTAVVKAISGGATSEELELSVGAAAASRVVVTASPNQIPSGGTSTITARVMDTAGNPLSGVLVSFSTDSGSLSNTSVNTSSTGEAQVTLTTNRDATVTATAGVAGSTGGASSTAKVTVGAVPELGMTVGGSQVEGGTVTFAITVTATAATEGFESLVIDFGDGTTSGTLSGTAQTVAHVYESDGAYTVVATGTSAGGATKRATAVVVIAERPLVDVVIAKAPTTAVAKNEPVVFTATVTGGTPTSYSWTFGDGSSFKGSSQVTHAYSTSGTKTVNVTVTTTEGTTGKGQTQVVVNP